MTRLAIHGVDGRMGQALVYVLLNSDKPERLSRAYARPGATSIGLTVHNNGVAIKDEKPLLVSSSASIDSHDFDVLIDFSTPPASLQAVARCLKTTTAIMIGTTGFSASQRQKIEKAAQRMPVLLAANTSLGVNVCMQLLRLAATRVGPFADIEIIDAHHRDKVDAPSGTALQMGEVLAQTLRRDLSACSLYGRHGKSGVRAAETIAFHAIRGGDLVGEHKVLFLLDGEQIEISHKVSNRLIFARGALAAAMWLDKKPPGLYTMDSVLSANEEL